MAILDQYGREIDTEELLSNRSEEYAYSVRRLLNERVSEGLTPGKLASILKAASNNDIRQYVQLAEDIEEKDLHYRAQLNTRKIAVSALDIVVEPKGNTKQDKRIADEVSDLLNDAALTEIVFDLLDSFGKGFSVAEVQWDTSGRQWMPQGYNWLQPYYFTFDEKTQNVVHALTPEAPSLGEPLMYGKYICHKPRLKSGIPIRGGFAYAASWGYLFKNYAMKDWLAFLEVFGFPIRLGRYDPSANPAQIGTLMRALRGISVDAAAVLPRSMDIEIVDGVKGSGSNDSFEKLAKYIDAQISKLVLGQTMTADDGSSQSQANVHNEVRLDIVENDAKQLAATLQRNLVRPYLLLNYGKEALKSEPTVSLPVPRPQDITAIIGAVEKLVPLGLKVSQRNMREVVGLDVPNDDDELLTVQAAPPAPPTQNLPVQIAGELNRIQQPGDEDLDSEFDDLEDHVLDEWQEIRDPLITRALERLFSAGSIEKAKEMLAEIAQEIDDENLIQSLTQALFKSRGLGRLG